MPTTIAQPIIEIEAEAKNLENLDGLPIHLTIDRKSTLCGTPVGNPVSWKAFSENPCKCCVAKRMTA